MSFIICSNAAVHWLQLYITYLIQVKVLTYWNPFPLFLSVFRVRLDVLCAVGWMPQDQSLTRLVLHLPWWHCGLMARELLFSFFWLWTVSSLHYYWAFCAVPAVFLQFVALIWKKNQNKTKTNKQKKLKHAFIFSVSLCLNEGLDSVDDGISSVVV